MFKPRYLHFYAYYNMLVGRRHKAHHYLNKALIEANRHNCLYDVEWCRRSKNCWFPVMPEGSLAEEHTDEMDDEGAVFLYEFNMMT